MNNDTLSIPVMFQRIKDFKTKDTRFTKVKIWLMHLGENFNGSFFDKEVVMRAIPTLANTPILGYIEESSKGEDDFSDHRYEMELKDGKRKYVYKGTSFGVIPESCNPNFEFRLCDDGVEREFLTVDGLIWTKLDGADLLLKDSIKKQSMELDDEYEGYRAEDGTFHFTSFKFYGACMLGIDHTPAMINSTVEVNFCDNMISEIRNKLDEFNKFTKGGLIVEEIVKETETVETIEPEVVETAETIETVETVEVIEVPAETIETVEPIVEPVAEPVEAATTEFESEPSETVEEFAKEDKKTRCEAETEEEDEKSGEEIEEEEEKTDHSIEPEEVVDYEAKFKELETAYTELQENYDGLKTLSDGLQEFKDNTLKAIRVNEENEIFEKYNALNGVAEYEAIKENRSTFATVEELEKEIALVYVNASAKLQTYTAKQSTPSKYYFGEEKTTEGRYGYLHQKYN